MSDIGDCPKVVPIAIVEQPYSVDYREHLLCTNFPRNGLILHQLVSRIATFILRAPIHVLTPITKNLNPDRLTAVLEETRCQPELLPKPLECMEEMCTMLIVNLNTRKRRWGVTRGIVPLALLLLWRLRCAREEGKGRDERGMMCGDHVCVIVAVSRAIASMQRTFFLPCTPSK